MKNWVWPGDEASISQLKYYIHHCFIKQSTCTCTRPLHLISDFDCGISNICISGAVHEELTRAFEKTKRAALKSKDSRTDSTFTLSSLNQNYRHYRQQRCDIVGEFASSISSELVAQSAQIDLDNSMENFKVHVCKLNIHVQYMYMYM